MNLGAPELLIVLAVVLVLFGGTKLPGLARSLGRAQHEFKEGAVGRDQTAYSANGAAASRPEAERNDR